MDRKIYLVVPKLIEQPTWGGEYIINAKKWQQKKEFNGLKIGQSYELYSGSLLRGDLDTSLDRSFTGELGYAMEPDKTFYSQDKSKLVKISDLIKENPAEFLGSRVIKKHNGEIKVLIKFTQAKGNSFQIHVKEKDQADKWRFKAEGWYFFEPGLITLGIKSGVSWQDYEKACQEINSEMINLSRLFREKKISFSQMKQKICESLAEDHPLNYVNLIKTKKNALVDLSGGGVHHSWEEDDVKCPLGNVLYELCLDVMDPVSVLRAFDKGKVKKDGTLRKLNILEYFKYVDRDKKENLPETHMVKPVSVYKDKHIQVTSLFRTDYYCLDQILLSDRYSGEHSSLEGSYHHLFVKKGKLSINYDKKSLLVSEGHSCFIPNNIAIYELENLDKDKTEILKTFIN